MKNNKLNLPKLGRNCVEKVKVRLSDIKQGPMRQEILPKGFIQRVINYKEILKEVETSSLEKTISNFQRDLYPETELMVWESIASLYDTKSKANPNWSIREKKECFSRLLLSTMS